MLETPSDTTPDTTPDTMPSVDDLQREIRGLKRKLTLAETALKRAQVIASAQERIDTILSASLRKELQFFKLVLESTTNILLLFDFDVRFAYASRTFLTEAEITSFGLINGLQFHEVFKSIVTESILQRLSESIQTAVEEKRTVTLEEQIDFHFKGTAHTYAIYITPMTDDNGNSTGIMLLFNDITEINNALETANRASMAKSNFLANMSHEIRTPLNAILGMAAIARGSEDIEKIHYCLDKINDSSTHLLGVINDILDMSKIETNHFELSYSEFVFEKMLLRIIDVMRFKIEEKHIRLTLTCDPRIPYAIESDEQRLAQVVMNLLSNAVKFTPEHGRIAIHAEVQDCQQDRYTLRISITDSGIGISDEQKPRLFKAFAQADSSISRKFGGTGLGLAISKNIITLMGGEITLDSVEGRGTTFCFTIKTRAGQSKPAAKCKLDRSQVRILVVDDMPEVRTGFSLYAEKLGVYCDTAESAAQAHEILQTQSYDIVFTDWRMPDVDGLTFAKQLSADKNKRMVVIMITAADWTEMEQDARNAGVRSFISKPILLPVLESVLDAYCEELSGQQTEIADNFSDKTILLVDDIEINREIIISLLEDTGVNIVCAENGKEAVKAFAKGDPVYDLIFMDLQMPEMDGYEATRRIRALEVNAAEQVPIIAMTANVFKEDIDRCLSAGMNDHVGKPVNVEEILQKIRQWTG